MPYCTAWIDLLESVGVETRSSGKIYFHAFFMSYNKMKV